MGLLIATSLENSVQDLLLHLFGVLFLQTFRCSDPLFGAVPLVLGPSCHTELCRWEGCDLDWDENSVPWGSHLLQLLSPSFCHIKLKHPPCPSEALCGLSLLTITCIIEGLTVSLILSLLSIL